MTTSDKLLVVETQDRVVRVQEFGVEDDLDTIAGSVEKLDTSDLVQNRVGAVVGHVVGDDRRQRVSLESENSSLEKNLVLRRQEILSVGHFGTVLSDC